MGPPSFRGESWKLEQDRCTGSSGDRKEITFKGPADLNTMPLDELLTEKGRLADLQQKFPVRHLSKGFLNFLVRDKSEFGLPTFFPLLVWVDCFSQGRDPSPSFITMLLAGTPGPGSGKRPYTKTLFVSSNSKSISYGSALI